MNIINYYYYLLLLKLYLPSDENVKFTEMKWLQEKIRKLPTLATRGPLASRPNNPETRKPRGENAENSLIFYCGFKTVLTDQVRAINHKYKYTKSKQLNIWKAKVCNIIIKKNISITQILVFQSYGSSFMKGSIVKGFGYVTSTFGSKP